MDADLDLQSRHSRCPHGKCPLRSSLLWKLRLDLQMVPSQRTVAVCVSVVHAVCLTWWTLRLQPLLMAPHVALLIVLKHKVFPKVLDLSANRSSQ